MEKEKNGYSNHDIIRFKQFLSGNFGKVDLARDGERIKEIKLEIALQKL